MNLREFISNNVDLNKRFPIEDRLKKEKPKVLGIPWDIEKDKIHISFSSKMAKRITRRNVLRGIASTFDPLGLAVPCLLEAKLFFQKLWEGKKGWDEPLEPEDQKIWEKINKNLEINPIEVERRIAKKRRYISAPCVF